MADDRVEPFAGPIDNLGIACGVSKIKALKAAEDFVETKKPTFDVIHIHPAYVIGRNELALDVNSVLKGTNAMVLGHILGEKFDVPRPSGSVHVDDVARLHILALDPKVKGGQSFLGVKDSVWNDALDIVKKHFPQAVKDRKLPANGDQPTTYLRMRAGRRKFLGSNFRTTRPRL